MHVKVFGSRHWADSLSGKNFFESGSIRGCWTLAMHTELNCVCHLDLLPEQNAAI